MFEHMERVLLVIGGEIEDEDQEGEKDDAVVVTVERLGRLGRGKVGRDAEEKKEDMLDTRWGQIRMREETTNSKNGPTHR